MGVHQACQVRVTVGEEREREGKRDGGTPGMPGESYRRRREREGGKERWGYTRHAR